MLHKYASGFSFIFHCFHETDKMKYKFITFYMTKHYAYNLIFCKSYNYL